MKQSKTSERQHEGILVYSDLIAEKVRNRSFLDCKKREYIVIVPDLKEPLRCELVELNPKNEQIWEHVSLVADGRCPTYEEMANAKDVFWKDDELVIQVHPPKSEYVNIEEYKLHLWRPKKIYERTEKNIKAKIIKKYREILTRNYSEKDVLIPGNTKIVAIFGQDRWPTWEEVCQVKQKYWEPEEAAVQFNISAKEDLNDKFMILLWDASDMMLP